MTYLGVSVHRCAWFSTGTWGNQHTKNGQHFFKQEQQKQNDQARCERQKALSGIQKKGRDGCEKV